MVLLPRRAGRSSLGDNVPLLEDFQRSLLGAWKDATDLSPFSFFPFCFDLMVLFGFGNKNCILDLGPKNM